MQKEAAVTQFKTLS